jgi:tRNA-specific 2-thiouridylase
MTSRRVAVALSGGVDSTVAASLLLDAGHDVFAVMLRLFDDKLAGKKSCCSQEAEVRAEKIAGRLGIPFHLIDETDAFESTIIEHFVSSYMQGLTPNPCVECNREMKFGKLLDKAQVLGADYLATGHYARLEKIGCGTVLKRAADEVKDQSYMLCRVRPEALEKVMFPLGRITKDETVERFRKLALGIDAGGESQEVCFAGDEGYRDLLRTRVPSSIEPGPVVDSAGKTIGHHEGISNFTIGQRRGIGISAPEPLYVLQIVPETGTVVVGVKKDLLRKSCNVRDICWISEPSGDSLDCDVKIRYAHKPAPAQVTMQNSSAATILFEDLQSAVTPGQVAAFIDDGVILGGGEIVRET